MPPDTGKQCVNLYHVRQNICIKTPERKNDANYINGSVQDRSTSIANFIAETVWLFIHALSSVVVQLNHRWNESMDVQLHPTETYGSDCPSTYQPKFNNAKIPMESTSM